MRVYKDPMSGIYVLDDPIANPLGQDPLLTTFILTQGALQDEFSPGYELFPEVDVPQYTFKVPVSKGEGLVPVKTVRTYGAQIKTVRYAETYETYSLLRHTLQGVVDDDEILQQIAPIDRPARAAALARRRLLMGLEVEKADLVADDANFGLVLTVTAGNGWNQVSSAMRADIKTAVDYLEGVLGIGRTNFEVALFGSARIAALENEEIRASLAYGGALTFPTVDVLTRFLGVRRVWEAYKVYKPTEDADTVPLYQDCAVVYYPGEPSRLADIEGDRPWGRTFTLGSGVALTPYYIAARTVTAYPWQKRERPIIINPESAVKIESPYQTEPAP